MGQNTWNVLYTRYTAKHGLKVPYPGIVLHTGSSGGTVRLVQQKLNSLGERLKDDGKYGAATAAAVQRFQRRNSLTADGSVGYATWERCSDNTQAVKRFGMASACALAIFSGRIIFKFRDTGASADAPVSHFHSRSGCTAHPFGRVFNGGGGPPCAEPPKSRRSLYFSCGACTISTEYVCAEQESDRQSR